MLMKYALLLIGICSLFATHGYGQAGVFTYQGRLTTEGILVNGTNSMKFSLWDSASGGAAVGAPVTNLTVPVSNGLFAVALDFGIAPFSGAERWLEIGIGIGTNANFTTLTPRQKLTRSPYAIMAHSTSNLLGPLPASQLSGAIPDAALSTNIARLNSNQTFTAANTFSNVAIQGALSLGALTVSPSDGGTLNPSRGFLRLNPANVILLSTSTAINNGSVVGSILVLQGISQFNTVSINDNANVQLGAATRIIGQNDTLTLIWDGTDWIEIAYVNN